MFYDPSGEFFLTAITAVINTFKNIFKHGINTHHYNWHQTEMAFKIDMGLFKVDSNRTFFGQVLQIFSRFTWEIPQTTIGYLYSGARNLANEVDRVEYFGGATFVINENAKGSRWGVSLGNFINANIRGGYDDDGLGIFGEDGLYLHEYGHTFQSQRLGLFYIPVIGIPSLLSSTFSSSEKHNNRWYELLANRWAWRYINKHFNTPTWPFPDDRPLN